MLGVVIVFLRNLIRGLRNLWRRLWRRRVDYVRFDLQAALPEFATPLPWWQRRLTRQASLSLDELRRAFALVVDDPHARGVILRINGLAGGWATLQSLRDEMARLRSSGKRVVVYLLSADTAGYYVATAANTIIMPPSATFGVVGLHSEVQYLRDALAHVGIEAELFAVSPYKAAGEVFIRSDMSPENREQLERLIEQRYTTLVQAIAEGRNLSEATVRALIDRAPLEAPTARDSQLIDAALYDDQLDAYLAPESEAASKVLRVQDWPKATRSLRLPMLRAYRQRVGVVVVEGTITGGASRNVPLPIPLFGGQQAGAESVIQALRAAEQQPRLAAVLLYINSPGGDSFASDLMWREILRVRQHKPVVVVMGDAAASGGYYIAAPASAIVAQPGTLTGSIGVFSLRPVIAGLLARADITTATISRGERSGLLSISQPLVQSERDALHEQVMAIYATFKQRVRDGRKMNEEQLEPIAGGRVWTGAEARDLGLVDQLGGVPEALLKAQQLAGIAEDRRMPLTVIHIGRESLPAQPFPQDTLFSLTSTLEQALRPRVWAVLPFVGLDAPTHQPAALLWQLLTGPRDTA